MTESGFVEARSRRQLGTFGQQHIDARQVDVAIVGQVAAQRGQHALVNAQQLVQGAFANLQRRQMRQKIIANEKAHKYKVVDHSFEVGLKGKAIHFQFACKVFTGAQAKKLGRLTNTPGKKCNHTYRKI